MPFPIAAALGISAGASLLGSLFGSSKSSNAAIEAAKLQAQATRAAAETQAAAINKQGELNAKLQQDSLNLSKQQHNDYLNNFRNMQMSLQMMAGQQSTENRERASQRILRNGGRVRKHFSYGGTLPAIRKAGGKGIIVPSHISPDGYIVFKAIGNSHNQKDKNGATGIRYDIGKGKNKKKIEIEGGEDIAFAPNGEEAIVLSARNQEGIIPSEEVDNGANVNDMAMYQDLVNNSSPVRGRRLRNGARVKCPNGDIWNKYWDSGAGWVDLAGSGANLLGNVIGGIITSSAAGKAAQLRSDANAEAARLLSEAYGNLKTVDIDSAISDRDYQAAQAMPVIVNPYLSNRAEIEGYNRDARRAIRGINSSTASSAARLNRIAGVYDRLGAARAKSYEQLRNMQGTYQARNAEIMSSTAIKNAELANEAARMRNAAKLDLLKYNNQIENMRITQPASFTANALTSSAEAQANAANAKGTAWANAIASGFNSLGNVGANYADFWRQMEIANMMKSKAYNPNNTSNYIDPDSGHITSTYGQGLTFDDINFDKPNISIPRAEAKRWYIARNGGKLRLRKVKC